ncbi:MAG: glucokinase [Actinomycetota bacterium]|jgi:glucokinase|nr:glucokinase [Actinomycetota bacterium]
MSRTVVAVDIGGTKLDVGIVDADGRVRDRRVVATPHPTDAETLFAALTAAIDDLDPGPHRPDAVGVGCGGPMTRGGEAVSPLNIRAWRGFPLRARLAEHSGLPVCIDNDAKALARAEGWLGAAAGVRDYIAMVVSTGVGGGIVVDGRLLEGADGNAGHVGHIMVEPDGAVCGCGARGCVEAEASGTAIARLTGRAPADAPIDVRVRTGRLVGRAIASVANLLDLQLAVVSGSVALGYGDDFFGAAQAEIDARCRLDFARATRVVPGGLRGDGPLVGAAAVALFTSVREA